MDEAREEREELAALGREDAEDARVWTDDEGLEWAELVTLETERWSRG